MILGREKENVEPKYSFLELLFANKWQWVRRISHSFWVKDNASKTSWVKYTNDELEYLSSHGIFFGNRKDEIVEDWR